MQQSSSQSLEAPELPNEARVLGCAALHEKWRARTQTDARAHKAEICTGAPKFSLQAVADCSEIQ